jgi:hypothetical protein
MAKTNAKLCSRLEHLEARRAPKQIVSVVFLWHWIPQERRENLAPGERIVQDHYRQCDTPSTQSSASPPTRMITAVAANRKDTWKT